MNFTWHCCQWTLLGTALNELYLRLLSLNLAWDRTELTLPGATANELHLNQHSIFPQVFRFEYCFHMHFWRTKTVHQTCIKSAKVHQKCLSFFPGFIPFKKKNNEKFFKDPFNFVINLALKVKQGSHWDFFDIFFLRPATGLSGFHSNPWQTLWEKGPRSTQSRLIQQSLVQCSVLETRYEKCNVVLLASIPDLPSSNLNLPKTFSFQSARLWIHWQASNVSSLF